MLLTGLPTMIDMVPGIVGSAPDFVTNVNNMEVRKRQACASRWLVYN